MLPYLVVTGLIGLMAALTPRRQIEPASWILAFVGLLVFVGLRHHVGMDWNNYLIMIRRVSSGTLLDSWNYAEPGFASLLWASANLGAGVYGSNLVGTLVFCLGLFRYASTTQYPWIALTVAMPYLVIVIAMSANRQAVAIGILLWTVAGWARSGLASRMGGVLLASLFHASALVFLAYVAAGLRTRRSLKLILGAMSILLSVFILQTSGVASRYDANYVTGQLERYRSEGAVFHVLFNAGPAVLYFLVSPRIRDLLFPDQLHRLMAWTVIGLFPLVLVVPNAAGRVSLYFFPVSMYVFSALPLITKNASDRLLLRYGISSFMVAVAAVWLVFSNSGPAHIPYGNMLSVPPYKWELCCR